MSNDLVERVERQIIDAIEAQFDIHSMDPEDWAEMSCAISNALKPVASLNAQLERMREALDEAKQCLWANGYSSSEPVMLKIEAATLPLTGLSIPADVHELVVAARLVAFEGATVETTARLDRASEAFADRVPWDDAPGAALNLNKDSGR